MSKQTHIFTIEKQVTLEDVIDEMIEEYECKMNTYHTTAFASPTTGSFDSVESLVNGARSHAYSVKIEALLELKTKLGLKETK